MERITPFLWFDSQAEEAESELLGVERKRTILIAYDHAD